MSGVEPHKTRTKRNNNNNIPTNPEDKTRISLTGVEKGRFKCERCQKLYRYQHLLDNHMDLHKFGGIKCDLCDQEFKSQGYLDQHRRSHFSCPYDQPLKCPICHLTFPKRYNFEGHMLTHSEKKPLLCEVCGKGYIRKNDLRHHMLNHTGERPHQCTYCQKCFKTKNVLTEHIRIHTKEKRFCCEACGDKFTHRSTLSKHMRIHKKERLHQEAVVLPVRQPSPQMSGMVMYDDSSSKCESRMVVAEPNPHIPVLVGPLPHIGGLMAYTDLYQRQQIQGFL